MFGIQITIIEESTHRGEIPDAVIIAPLETLGFLAIVECLAEYQLEQSLTIREMVSNHGVLDFRCILVFIVIHTKGAVTWVVCLA
jgi:hypothetical protein